MSSSIISPTKSAILFDLDGTLVNSSPVHERAFTEALAAFSLPAKVRYEVISGMSTPAASRVLGVPDALVDDFTRMKRERYRHHVEAGEVVAFPGASKLLYGLSRLSWRLALVTSASRVSTESVLESLGWMKVFEFVVDAESVARSKPDPEPFQMAAERMQIAADHCIGVEDSESGMSALAKARIDAIRIVHGGRESTALFDLLAQFEGAGARC
jgi:HAD superfamily hydrolase (TIGR01509 family)